MPMGGKLKDAEIEDMVGLDQGGRGMAGRPPRQRPTSSDGKYVISPERKSFWSFLPLKDPAPPQSQDPKWAKTPIDHFVLAHLEKQGLKPVRAGVKARSDSPRDARPDRSAADSRRDRGLRKGHLARRIRQGGGSAAGLAALRRALGPRTGWTWRATAKTITAVSIRIRAATSLSQCVPYRDWVIQAFNDDLPYDKFVKAQIAGDLMDAKVRYKMLPATGFLGLGPWYYDNGSVEVTRADERHDRVDAVTRGFLGLTVACARCHDHKYDPIPQTDYYSLAGVF